MRLFVTFLCLGVLLSCDKREDYYSVVNENPQADILITNQFSYLTTSLNGNQYTDSLKVNREYSMVWNLSDETGQLMMLFEGDGMLKINGTLLTSGDSLSVSDLDPINVKWSSATVGTKNFQVFVSDPQGGESEYRFQIRVIDNIPAQFSWAIEDVNQLDPLEKKIVVTGDDGDLHYGGGMLYWQYIINGDTTNYYDKQYNYIFPSPGSYTIGVRGLDNDTVWSNTITLNNVVIN